MKLTKEISDRLNRISHEAEHVRVARRRMITHLEELLEHSIVDGDYNSVDPHAERDLLWSEAVLSSVIDDYYNMIGGNGYLSAQVEFMRKHAIQPTNEGARRRFVEGDSI